MNTRDLMHDLKLSLGIPDPKENTLSTETTERTTAKAAVSMEEERELERRRAEKAEAERDKLREALEGEIKRLRNWDSKAVSVTQAHEDTADRLEAALQSFKGEGSEAKCETCDGNEVGPTGECRVAMSGPSCLSPDCPPCQHPELEPCPDCKPDREEPNA